VGKSRFAASVKLREFSDQSTVEAHEQQPLLFSTQIEEKTITQIQAPVTYRDRKRKLKTKEAMSQEAVNTPGLDQTVQDFKAIEDRDPKKLNVDVKVCIFPI